MVTNFKVGQRIKIVRVPSEEMFKPPATEHDVRLLLEKIIKLHLTVDENIGTWGHVAVIHEEGQMLDLTFGPREITLPFGCIKPLIEE